MKLTDGKTALFLFMAQCLLDQAGKHFIHSLSGLETVVSQHIGNYVSTIFSGQVPFFCFGILLHCGTDGASHTRDWTSDRAIKTIEMLTGRQAEIPAASADAKALSL